MQNTKFNRDWYDKEAIIMKETPYYYIIKYSCNNSGTIMDYKVFPGINLVFMDFKSSKIFDEPIPNRDIIDIRHYREGRVEFEFENHKVFYMQEDEFCINSIANTPAKFSFPFKRCSGVSILIDEESINEDTCNMFSSFGINLKELVSKLKLECSWYICKTPKFLLHIFNEFYNYKGEKSINYFKIKIVELLYHLNNLNIEDYFSTTYYSKEHIKIVKRVHKKMIENLDTKIPLGTLLLKEDISMATFQTIFKQIYGNSPYAYLKNYKMNFAAAKLREKNMTISQIAISLGYNNASKFSKAFRDILGILPKDYRSRKNFN
ncbi:helix-turn-helix domain-containing protein [Anaerovorax odorimutans]|uniref:helix-turn-helix domain-containing protein n=1 Tax=Anaerovorax odorimutans TaxID=109327 RepID=UPI000403CBAA|nr:AraC family transcriptional regulator [Anaerovorax odorimutans]